MASKKLLLFALLCVAPALWARVPVLKAPPYTYEVAKDWQLARTWFL